jgi:hypothetical protein
LIEGLATIPGVSQVLLYLLGSQLFADWAETGF